MIPKLKGAVVYIAVAASAAFVLSGCGDKAKTGGAGKDGEGKAAVIATVNGREITADDFKAAVSRLSPEEMQALAQPDNQRNFLDSLVNKQIILQDAEKKGVEKDPEVVKMLKPLKEEIVWRQYVKKEVLDKAEVSDKEVKDYFEANKADLGSIRLSHILVGSKEEAESLIRSLNGGGDFAKLAKQLSLDRKTRDSGGDLGYVSWLDFGSPSLKEAAFKLKVGEVSSVVVSQFGYHVLKTTDKKPAAEADFDRLKDDVKELLLQKKKEEMFEAMVKGLKDKAKVDTDDEAYKEALQGVLPGKPAAE